MNKTKEFLMLTLLVLALTLVIAAIPTEKEYAVYDDTLRLHILANSDSDEDQGTKLYIRDRLLTEYGRRLSGSESKASAEETVTALLYDIEDSVEGWLNERGYSYGATVTLSREWYETREYEDFSLPAGYYMSVRVLLGEGEGQNWWCVMYPPLCLDVATANAPSYTYEEETLIRAGEYSVKFKILELMSKLSKKG